MKGLLELCRAAEEFNPADYATTTTAEAPAMVFEPTTYPAVRFGEIEIGDEALDFVEGWFTTGGVSVVYAPSNVGKTFFVMDLMAAVAMAALNSGDAR